MDKNEQAISRGRQFSSKFHYGYQRGGLKHDSTNSPAVDIVFKIREDGVARRNIGLSLIPKLRSCPHRDLTQSKQEVMVVVVSVS